MADKKTILTVMGEQTAEPTVRLLVACGFAARNVRSAEEVLSALRAKTADAVLVDVPPDADETFALVAGLAGEGRDAGIVLSDASATVERARRARESGAFDYLPRPSLVNVFRTTLAAAADPKARASARGRNLRDFLERQGVSVEVPETAPVPAAETSSVPAVAEASASPVRRSVDQALVREIRRGAVAGERVMLQVLARQDLVDGDVLDAVSRHLETAAARPSGPISLFEELERQDLDAAKKFAAKIVDLTHCPPVPLDQYRVVWSGIDGTAREVLETFVAVPFAKLSDTVLVAMPNPSGASARAAVERVLGAKCRFYVCNAAAALRHLGVARSPKD